MEKISLSRFFWGVRGGAGGQAGFGKELMVWKSVRGVRSDNGAWENGAMVLKTDGSDYDGASAAFWNDGYSSAFLIEEYVAGETAIEEVKNEVVVEGIYDLSGRRVENPVKGLYIINGKKVLVK